MTNDDQHADGTLEQPEDGPTAVPPTGAAPPAAEEPALRRPRRKVTGVQLEARFTTWRQNRRDRHTASPFTLREKPARRLVVLLALGVLAAVLASAVIGDRFASTRATNRVTIAALEDQLAGLQSTPRDAERGTTLAAIVTAARTDADKVRDAQQAYAALYHRASAQPPTGTGAPTEALEATAEHRKVLAPLFSTHSYLIHGDDAYRWQNVVPFKPDTEIDPRFPWYVRYAGRKAADPTTYSWVVEAVTPAPDPPPRLSHGTEGEARVVWLCRDSATRTVLAWARADYQHDGTTGVFDELEVSVSAAGAAHQYPTSGTPDGTGVPQLGGTGLGQPLQRGAR
ncbi:hypothetical protein ACIQUM_07790 [Amycolatopsis azurea]|uniref:hypothetical protein n=1 Tax=Amycolatopsis azurea TaxID=36819 RepID=UPI0037F6500F